MLKKPKRTSGFDWLLASITIFSFWTADGAAIDRNSTIKVVDPTDESWAVSSLWTMVERRVNQTDLVRPSVCPAPCSRLFHAQRLNRSAEADVEEDTTDQHCYCRCSSARPVFNQATGECVATIVGCSRPIRTASAAHDPNSEWAPTVRLPENGEFLRFSGQILWQESRVKVKPKFGPRCNVTAVRCLRQESRWLDVSPGLFGLGWWDEKNTGGIIWTGTDEEKSFLVGALVQLGLDCVGTESTAHCFTFRVSGQLIFPNYSLQFYGPTPSRVETTVVITLLVILLLFSGIVYVVLWRVRWKMKKSKLISSLQLQFLYHMKQQEKEKSGSLGAAVESPFQQYAPYRSHHHYQALSAAQQRPDFDAEAADSNAMQPIIAKRKLYFSSEFFEPQHMQNPPPMAEHFLQDLRKMIEIAKQRINMRRHVQQLGPIAEEPPEFYQPYMKTLRTSRRTNDKSTIEPKEVKKNVTSSASIRIAPKPKVDESSRESTKEQAVSFGNEAAAQTPRRPIQLMPAHKLPMPGSMSISTPTASSGPGPATSTATINSRIPVMSGAPTVGQKSPRITSRPLSLATPISSNRQPPLPTSAPPLPPRNNPPTTPPKSLQLLGFQSSQNSNPTSSSTPNGATSTGHSRTAEVRRKMHAVFPTDAMLKKSLPRRSKNRTAKPNGVRKETNM